MVTKALFLQATSKFLLGVLAVALLVFLEDELEGYREYKARVKHRLIPFVW